jgi:general secretion pathway protein D
MDWRGVYCLFSSGLLALLLSGCALSPEQLSLPGSILSPGGGPPASASGRSGVALSNAAAPETQSPRVYEGSGAFTGPVGEDKAASGEASGKVDENGVTLNLVGASVPEVAKTVLGDILHLNYTVSDKVKATITLNTAHPVPKADLLKIFEAVLRSEGAGLTVDNGLYRIVPADEVAAGGGRWAPSRGRGQVGSAMAVAPLRYVSAAEMERILKAVAPQSSILRVDEARNLLLISGTANELASIRATIEAFDLDWMQGMSFALLPVETGDPEAIAKELDTIFANDRDASPTKGIVRFVPNTRLKSVLVISSRPEYLRKAEGWLRRIDLAAQATEKQVHVYHVRNRPAGELAALLQKVYGAQSRGGGVSISTQPREAASVLSSSDSGFGQTAGSAASPASGLSAGLGVAPAAATQSPASATGLALPQPAAAQPASGVVEATAGEAPQEGAAPQAGDRASGIGIIADDPNNSLIVTATYREYQRVREILSRIDIAASQVLIEATIAEVTLTDTMKFGLKWFFQKGNHDATFTTSALGSVASSFPGFSYFLNTPNVQVVLDALNSVTTVNLVSSPSLMVLDNKKAVLQIGDEVPIATQQAQSVLTPGAPVINSISFRSTGVILGITPRVGDNGRIQLDIEQEVSDVKATNTSTLDSPTISQRRVKTSVAVGDGQTIMLAGLMRDQNTVDHTKLPLIGDIPVVGNLFKNKSDDIQRTELFIAITPHLVSDPRQIRGIADEFRDRINMTTRPQRAGPPDKRENFDRIVK